MIINLRAFVTTSDSFSSSVYESQVMEWSIPALTDYFLDDVALRCIDDVIRCDYSYITRIKLVIAENDEVIFDKGGDTLRELFFRLADVRLRRLGNEAYMSNEAFMDQGYVVPGF